MAAGGKGSRQRQATVSDDVVANNWELAFGRKEKTEAAPVEETKQVKEPADWRDAVITHGTIDQDVALIRDMLVNGVISDDVLVALFMLTGLGLDLTQKLFSEVGKLSEEDFKKLIVVIWSMRTMGLGSDKASVLSMLKTILETK